MLKNLMDVIDVNFPVLFIVMNALMESVLIAMLDFNSLKICAEMFVEMASNQMKNNVMMEIKSVEMDALNHVKWKLIGSAIKVMIAHLLSTQFLCVNL